jgi:hypothetical protein
MDCDKLEAAIIDELYGEIDEVTGAAVRRHIAGCGRCSTLLAGLRATRRVAVLPLVDPPRDLERRILRAASTAPAAVLPVRRHLARAVSAAGSWAMRPQTAMAAVFLVMLGASVLLLRGRSSRAPANAEMIVTEKGAPAPAPVPISREQHNEVAEPAIPPTLNSRPIGAKAAGPPAAGAPLDLGSSATRERPSARFASAPKVEDGPVALRAEPASTFAGAAAPASPAAAPAARSASRPTRDTEGADTKDLSAAAVSALGAARALRDSQGCRAAVSRFDEVAQRAAGSSSGWEALLESAHCYRSLGDAANARSRLTTLLGVPQFKDRALSELDLLDRASAAQAQP